MIYPYQKVIPFEYEDSMDDQLLIEDHKTLGTLHSIICNGIEFTSKNQFPIVRPIVTEVPKNICSVHRLHRKTESFLKNQCGHFFTNDKNIEPFWNYPYRYLSWLKKFDCITSTDFSIYTNMVQIQKLWNSFRNKLMTAFFQRNGISVIPAPSWADSPDIDIFMEGWPKNSVIAINSTGIGRDKRCRYVWLDGYYAMLDILKPLHIIRYGAYIEGENKEISTYYGNDNKKYYRYGS